MKGKIAVLMMVVAAAGLLVTDEAFAQGDSVRARHGGARRAIAAQTSAVAALDGVGAVEGWGRITVKDVALTDGGMHRTVAIHLLGLAPEAIYTVTLDTVQVAEVTTDSNGDARVRLESPSDTLDPVPEALPPAAELFEAVVFDDSSAAALEGWFTARSFGHVGPQDLVWMERIRLDSEVDPDIRGIARVERDSDDQQSFETRACGLEAGAAYTIVVDEVTAGTATADEVGQAELELSTSDDSDLLPESLQPIEELRVVEWFDADGERVLIGTFSGENMVGSGPLRDRMGDGEGAYGSGNGSGEPGPHGDGAGGEGDHGGPHGDGDGSCDGSGEGGPHGDGSGDGSGEGGPHGDGTCDGSGQGGN